VEFLDGQVLLFEGGWRWCGEGCLLSPPKKTQKNPRKPIFLFFFALNSSKVKKIPNFC